MSETTSLDVSRKLREAGIEIETYSVWAERKDNRSSYVKHGLLDRRIYTYLVSAPTIAELRAYIEDKGEWQKFLEHLYGKLVRYRYREEDLTAFQIADILTNADSLALAYLGWKEKKG